VEAFVFIFLGSRLGKWFTALIWLCTGGLFMIGYLYDYWTLNEQISEQNQGS